ncbi:hypothetical protein BsWGS_08795 [Bradybaena similaris]
MGLLLKDKIELLTPLGSQEIQLLIGDITKLPLEEKVDFIFISAFYGSYIASKSTLIGSLKVNLGINVRELARQKELDLWKNFSCWVSTPLPAAVPFRRIVCFEYNHRVGPLTEQLSQIFLAMMPIFNNTEATVITPLLASGNQGFDGKEVLSALVNGACHWIQAGLPLHCLKIVVYSENPGENSKMDTEYLKLFAKLKTKWRLKTKKEVKISQPYDICLSFSPADKELAEKVTASLHRQAPDAKIHSTPFKFNHDQVWQTDIFSVMKVSQKIIVLLTPAYIEDTECIEQYNIALCCNRLKKTEVVIPFHMKTVGSFPSFMSIVQYVECSIFEDEEAASAAIETACADVIKSLKPVTAMPDDDTDQEGLKTLRLGRNTTYDIFISYSHRHKKEPRELADVLRSKYPRLNIFLDLTELKAGNIWQQAVYEAADRARCVVAFLTPGYLLSPVCNEEFNIALARHTAHDSVILVPVIADNLQLVPRSLTSMPCTDLGNDPENIARFAAKIVELVTKNRSRAAIPNVTMFKQMMAHKRGVSFIEQYYLAGHSVVKKTPQQFLDKLEGEVVFSYAQDSLKLAAIMSVILKTLSPKLVCHLKSASHSRHRREHLDTADVIVFFVSDQFVSTQSLAEELHTGLCRQRTVKDSTIVYFIQHNHMLPSPFYFQALPFSVSVDDSLWQTLEDPNVIDKPYLVDSPGMEGTYRCTDAQSYALTVAAHGVLYLLSQRGLASQITHSIVNIIQDENAADGIDDSQVSAQKIVIPIDSINLVKPNKHTPRNLPTLAGAIQQQQPSNGEVSRSHRNKTQDNRVGPKLRNCSEDEMYQLPPDLQRRKVMAHKRPSVPLTGPDGDRGRDGAAAVQGPQTLKKHGEQTGSQNQNRKQTRSRRTCCIL